MHESSEFDVSLLPPEVSHEFSIDHKHHAGGKTKAVKVRKEVFEKQEESRVEEAKMMKKEDKEKIKIGFKVYYHYFYNYLGGYKFFVVLLAIMAAYTYAKVQNDIYLAQWTQSTD